MRNSITFVVAAIQAFCLSCMADPFHADYDPLVEAHELLQEEAVTSLYDQIALDPSSLAGPTFARFSSPFASPREPDEDLGHLVARLYCGEAAREMVVSDLAYHMCGRAYLTGDRLSCVTRDACLGDFRSDFERDENGRWTFVSTSWVVETCGTARGVQNRLEREMKETLESLECGVESRTHTQYLTEETLGRMQSDLLVAYPDAEFECD